MQGKEYLVMAGKEVEKVYQNVNVWAQENVPKYVAIMKEKWNDLCIFAINQYEKFTGKDEATAKPTTSKPTTTTTTLNLQPLQQHT
ncbi:hypothetical protein DPMN_113000 [Dreissena polymorpha]|uniref:Uncharacterized protein n=2 Tax=Dreissena polymorpha TaxID=45954 RepID=A0A9D4KHF8_DREPO|nr:hypothetical protein DPMN_113000 [Dreissena polymorpha]